MEVRKFIVRVEPEHNGERLDRWLSRLDFIPSRSRASELISGGRVTLNGKTLKASARVQTGTEIAIELPPAQPSELQPLDRPIQILFEDQDLVVVNKPEGLVVHPSAGHAQDTLVNILLHHVGQLAMGFGEHRPGIVHRLDRDTSGILVVAKNDLAHAHLAQQFRVKTAHRVYWAIVHGEPKMNSGTVRSHLSRHPTDRKRFASSAQGKLAVTHFAVRERVKGLSWVTCRLETGRTHQIRVHLSESGWPIVGDVIYGRKVGRGPIDQRLGRLALHACELGFEHPRTGEKLSFKQAWSGALDTFARDWGFKNVE